MNCKNCGAAVTKNDKVCPACGIDIVHEADGVICPICGSKVAHGAVFCGSCGTTLVKKEEVKKNTCLGCGSELREGATFCGNCGKSVEGVPVKEPEKVEVKPTPKSTTKKKSTSSKKKAKEGKKGGCFKNILIVILVLIIMFLTVIVTGALGLLAFNFFFDDNSNSGGGGDYPTEPTSFEATEPYDWGDATEPDDWVVVIEPTEPETKKPVVVKPSGGDDGGNNGGSYTDGTVKTSGYVCPESAYSYLTRSDLAGKSKEEIALIRNEIYARHGYVFKNATYKNYFSSKDWYTPSSSFSESSFNAYEKANKDLIVAYEKEKGWR